MGVFSHPPLNSINGHKLAICPRVSPLGEMIFCLETTILAERQEDLSWKRESYSDHCLCRGRTLWFRVWD